MDLAQVEEKCRLIYGAAASPQVRFEAHRDLLFMQISAKFIEQSQYILENSTEVMALIYAVQSIELAMRRDWVNFPPDARIGLRDFLVRLLTTKAANPRYFVTKKIIQVLCELTHRSWMEDSRHHETISIFVQWIESEKDAELGLVALTELVDHFNEGRADYSDESIRRASQSFLVYESALDRCFSVAANAVWSAHSAHDLNMLVPSLKCLLSCLSFDFAGMGPEESIPSLSCTSLPRAWIPTVTTALKRLFTMYSDLWTNYFAASGFSSGDSNTGAPPRGGLRKEEEAASLVLQCLVVISGTRRTLFDPATRAAFQTALMEGTEAMLRTCMGFDLSETCVHHACRLLARSRVLVRYLDLAADHMYTRWIETCATFTCNALCAWTVVGPSTISYLLEFWDGLVRSIPPAAATVTSSNPNQPSTNSSHEYLLLTISATKVFEAYLLTRGDMAEAAADANKAHFLAENAMRSARTSGLTSRNDDGRARIDVEDVNPMASENELLDELALVVTLARCRYPQSASSLSSLILDALSARRDARLTQNASTHGFHARMALGMTIVGALIGGPINPDQAATTQQLDEINMELATICFRVVLESQNEPSGSTAGNNAGVIKSDPSTFVLEMATLYFLQCYQYLILEARTRTSAALTELRAKRNKSLKYLPVISRRGGFPNGIMVMTGASNSSVTPLLGGSAPSAFPFRIMTSGSGPGASNSVPSSPSSSSMGGGALMAGDEEESFPPAYVARPTRSFERLSTLSESRKGDSSGEEDYAGELIDDDMEVLARGSKSDAHPYRSSTQQQNPSASSSVIVDELDAMESGETREAAASWNRASVMQRSVMDRLGLRGGDRVMLDLSVRHIFSVLERLHQPSDQNGHANPDESSRMSSIEIASLVERALGVLKRLALGSSIVRTGADFTPRIVSSGALLLESGFIQELIRDPAPDRFPLLSQAIVHGRARTFLVSTLTKLFFLNTETPLSAAALASFTSTGHGINRETGQFLQPRVPASLSTALSSQPNSNLTTQERADDRFIEFMHSFTLKWDLLLAATQNVGLRQDEFRMPLISLFRDLRGVSHGADDAKEYDFVFSWFFPDRIGLLELAGDAWWDEPSITIPLLRLLSELVSNRGSRITFAPHSIGGHTLAIGVASALNAICAHLVESIDARLELERKSGYKVSEAIQSSLEQTVAPGGLSMATLQAVVEEIVGGGAKPETGSTRSKDDYEDGKTRTFAGGSGNVLELAPGATGLGVTVTPSAQDMKIVSICAMVVSRILAGRFTSVAALDAFRSDTLRRSKHLVLRLALAGPPSSVASYPKSESAIVLFLHTISENDAMDIARLPTPMFARAAAVLASAVTRLSSSQLSTPAAFAIEALSMMNCRGVLYAYFQADLRKQLDSNVNRAPGELNEPRHVALRPEGFVSSALGNTQRAKSKIYSTRDLRETIQLFESHAAGQPDLFAKLLTILLDRVLTSKDSELPNMYALMRPVAPLALLCPQALKTYVSTFVATQASARQALVAEAFNTFLMILLPPPMTYNPASHIAGVLKRHEEITRDLCRFVRKFKETGD